MWIRNSRKRIDIKSIWVYNTGIMMKKETLHFTFDRPRTRAHKVLFENDTPFKCKRVEPKNNYRRKPKHGKKEWLNADD